MRLARRFKVDIRDPSMTDDDAQNTITKELVKLQVDDNNVRNKVQIIDIKEVGKSSGDFFVWIIYDDDSLDKKKKEGKELMM